MIPIFSLLLICYGIICYLAVDMYLPAMPSVVRDLDITITLAQQTLTAWFLGASTFYLLLDPISDRFGRRSTLLIGGVLFITATWMCAFAETIRILLIARFMQGAAITTFNTAGYAALQETYPRKQAVQMIALVNSVVLLAPAIGPLLGGLFLQWLPWRWIFIFLALSASILWFGLCFIMKETQTTTQRLMFEWSQIFSNYQLILKNKAFMLNLVIINFNNLVKVAWLVSGPFLIVHHFKLNTLFFGLIQLLLLASQLLGVHFRKRMHHVEINRLINHGLKISLFSSVLAFSLSLVFPHDFIGLIISLMIFSFGTALATPLQRLCIEASPEPMDERMAVYFTLISLFCTISSLLFSFTYTGHLFWFTSLMVVLSCFAGLLRWLS
ncbi:hypothetical protein BEV13_05520, partial [Rickettsiella grylli]|uniref:MFS transporter n=1 Tax=Rickettsiella grylli TaxID=59196 RepID=UPI0008FD512D